MIALFSVDRLNASPAVFDREKLTWVNSQYLSSLPLAELLPHLQPFLAEVGLGGADIDPQRLAAAIELHRGRVRTLRELAAVLVPYFRGRLDYPPEAIAKFAAEPDLPAHLAALRDRFANLPPFTKEALEAELRAVAGERGIKAGALIHPTRTALSGSQVGPPLFDLVEVMGRDATLRHLDHLLERLREPVPVAPAEEQAAHVAGTAAQPAQPGKG
jgi:glutamyl-tRNA synthetase